MEALRSGWDRVWNAVAPGGAGGEVFQALAEKYAEVHRAYHNLTHIRDCLDQLIPVRHLLSRPDEVELAIWFHDAIYDTRQPDNEARSAEWAEFMLRENGVPADVIHRVGELVMLTAHRSSQLTGDDAILCDIDLAILGAAAMRFDTYDAAIRLEYSWVPNDVFRRERGRVLGYFLARPHIYHSQFFHERLEAQALANLLRVMPRYSS